MHPNSLVLPFAVPFKERDKAFTLSMEVAAILLLAEAKRKRWRLFETAINKTSFVSKLHYPLWAIPWENEALLIDGLGIISSTLPSQILPDVTSFIDDIDRSVSDRKQFWNTLEKHKDTFIDFAETQGVQVDALIMNKELLSAAFEYVKDSASLRSEESLTVILLPPKLDLQAAVESAKQVTRFHKQIQSEISSLEYAKNLLEETAIFHKQMAIKEVKFTREVYEEEISKLRPVTEKKVDQLQKERDARMAKMRRVIENELKAKEREREKRERALQGLELQRADSIRRREARKQRRDKIGVAHWEHRIQVCENRIREIKKRISALSEFIEKTSRQSEADIEKIRNGYQELIDQEKKKISDIEAQRDRDVESKQKEIETLSIGTSEIANRIEELANRKREEAKELKKLAMPWQFEDPSLLCLPFYLVGYQTEKKMQLQIFPPLRVMGSKGIVKSLQKTLASIRSASGVTLFLKPRSKVLNEMLDSALKKRTKSDKALSESLRQAAAAGNILRGQKFKETLIKGLEELKTERWITQKEADALTKTYLEGI
ncbi:MAG: hypothetical protein ACUVUE_06820 [Candidatus Bathycorpusculaceae bacterium]